MRANILVDSENIRAEIQKEEIINIIRAQKTKLTLKNDKFMRQDSFQDRGELGNERKRYSSFLIKRKRQIKTKQSYDKQRHPVNLEIHEQMMYFSVKRDYEKAIKSVKDQVLINQLERQLQFSPRALSNKQVFRRSSNFFEKIRNNDSRMKEYLDQKSNNLSRDYSEALIIKGSQN